MATKPRRTAIGHTFSHQECRQPTRATSWAVGLEALRFRFAGRSDHYGRTSLMFSDAETDEAAKVSAANTFWDVLLLEPDAMEDFEAGVIHLGAPVTLHFGCEDGEPFLRETPD